MRLLVYLASLTPDQQHAVVCAGAAAPVFGALLLAMLMLNEGSGA